jgi:ferrochelatase
MAAGVLTKAALPRRCLVVLTAHGESETAGFGEQYAVSWRTLAHAAEVMRLPAPLRVAICTAGALRKRLAGRAGSPHNGLVRAQADALGKALADDPIRYRVVFAFASAEPGLGAVLAAAPRDVDVLLLSMIPTDSRLSCGLFCRAAAAHPNVAAVRPLARLWEAPDLVAVHRAHVAAWLVDRRDADTCGQGGALVIALHGTLVADEAGRAPAFHTGSREKTRYGEALRRALAGLPGGPWQRVEIAYMNHAVGGQWSAPTMEDTLARLAREGVRRVWAYPAEHLVESAETLRLKKTLAAGPLERGHCLPCLNDSPALIEFLAARVRAAAVRQEGRPCDQCPLAPR